MNTCGLPRHSLSNFLMICVVFSLLLSACQPVNVPGSQQPVQPTAAQPPADQPDAQVTQSAAPVTQSPSDASAEINLDIASTAQDLTIETVDAVPASADRPWWEASPLYRRVTLQGYPVTSHLMKPQIFIYPVDELAGFNENAGRIAADLQVVLQTQQTGEGLPFLPLFNAAQVMHAQVQYLDFQNGKGVRYLTQFDQAPLPINNHELIYTFQGLTHDGKYYIAAVLPVTHPELPATQQVNEQQAAAFMNDFSTYLAETITWLEQQPNASFTPDLARLDALVQSIEVK